MLFLFLCIVRFLWSLSLSLSMYVALSFSFPCSLSFLLVPFLVLFIRIWLARSFSPYVPCSFFLRIFRLHHRLLLTCLLLVISFAFFIFPLLSLIIFLFLFLFLFLFPVIVHFAISCSFPPLSFSAFLL